MNNLHSIKFNSPPHWQQTQIHVMFEKCNTQTLNCIVYLKPVLQQIYVKPSPVTLLKLEVIEYMHVHTLHVVCEHMQYMAFVGVVDRHGQ